MTNKDLIMQYVDTGLGIPRYQFDKLSSSDKKTYLRKMLIAIEQEPSKAEYYHGELPYETQLKMVKKNPNNVGFIQSEEIQKSVLNYYGQLIKYIKNPSKELQLAALKLHGEHIKHIENPSEEVQMAAIQAPNDSVGMVISFIENPSEEVQMAAIKKNSFAMRNIKNPTEKVVALYDQLYKK
jgi:hypothetical protein